MEAITKKTVAVLFEGKKYALSDDITLGSILLKLGLGEDTPTIIQVTKEGLVLIPQI